ncbi:MAG TPA: antibiotic biosynthesis monooxygenase [Candidatus Eisenbacteria bacterium]|nr:antibiotic biosynthesis monooxygenase [Candidatus Eisenbacteria bacterium]
MTKQEPVTVVLRRRVKPGAEAAFEEAMRQLIQFARSFPGSRGIDVVRPHSGGAREYTIIHHFADLEARRAFKESADYRQWMSRLRDLTEHDPYITEQAGLGGWFTPPEEPRPSPPARVKMALVTFLGAYPLMSTLQPLLAFLLPGWHPLLRNVVAAAVAVASLTWLVMPLLTRIFAGWLFGARRT